jgi:TPR repeat protein
MNNMQETQEDYIYILEHVDSFIVDLKKYLANLLDKDTLEQTHQKVITTLLETNYNYSYFSNCKGHIYEAGIIIMPNNQYAFLSYLNGYIQNNKNVCSIRNVARCYKVGLGVAQNLELAILYYQVGYELNDDKSMMYLAEIYSSKKDYLRALDMYHKADSLGNRGAKLYLAHMFRLGLGTEKNEILGNYWENKGEEIIV